MAGGGAGLCVRLEPLPGVDGFGSGTAAAAALHRGLADGAFLAKW
eukprot:CAMPEP_0118884760 /NCGR_PEP_ID=MMETSP1163-20130328/23492_1 /TAXON_ID=124430 /ORGANISM="Phaeomonas parva, Strain CCMP2877" /LENGTH=44 /DNA_ID= /DNA_START= /DNA_END= /DNA_ORIENTATION=